MAKKDFEFKNPLLQSTTGANGPSIKISNGRLNISFPLNATDHSTQHPQKTHRTIDEDKELLLGNMTIKFRPFFEAIGESETSTLKDSKELSKLSLEIFAVINSKKPQHDG